MAVRPSTLANPFCLKKSSTREKWRWGNTDEIFLRMHQSKNLQVSLLSAGRNTDKNCNQSAIHMDESDGDDSDGIIDRISLTKNPARRKAAVPNLVLAEGKIPAYRPGLPRVSVVSGRWTLRETISVVSRFAPEASPFLLCCPILSRHLHAVNAQLWLEHCL